MLSMKAARRYAQSLLDVSIDTKLTDKVMEDCRLINQTLSDSRELALFLKSPIIKSDKKSAVLLELFEKNIQKLTAEFINIVVRKNRVQLLGAITQQFIEAYNAYAGIIPVYVESAKEMTSAQQKQLINALELKTGKKVELSSSVNPSLLGGLTVKIKDTVTDGSVKHKLESLDSLFKQSAL